MRRPLKVHLPRLDPLMKPLRPRPDPCGRSSAVAEQQFAQSVALVAHPAWLPHRLAPYLEAPRVPRSAPTLRSDPQHDSRAPAWLHPADGLHRQYCFVSSPLASANVLVRDLDKHRLFIATPQCFGISLRRGLLFFT